MIVEVSFACNWVARFVHNASTLPGGGAVTVGAGVGAAEKEGAWAGGILGAAMLACTALGGKAGRVASG